MRGEEDTCIGPAGGRQRVSVENGSGIAVRKRDDLDRRTNGNLFGRYFKRQLWTIDEQFVCIGPVCDAFCVLRFVNFITVLRLELELTHRRASWDWTRNTSWNDCIAVLP